MKLFENKVKNTSPLVPSPLLNAKSVGADTSFPVLEGDPTPTMRKQGWGVRISERLKWKIITATRSYSVDKAAWAADAVKYTTYWEKSCWPSLHLPSCQYIRTFIKGLLSARHSSQDAWFTWILSLSSSDRLATEVQK